jgi:hypothetical protein
MTGLYAFGLIQRSEKHYENSLFYGILHLICLKSECCK